MHLADVCSLSLSEHCTYSTAAGGGVGWGDGDGGRGQREMEHVFKAAGEREQRRRSQLNLIHFTSGET